MDALQETHLKPQHKKDHAESVPSPVPLAKTSNWFRPFSSKQEPNFKSFLMGGGGSQDAVRTSPPPNLQSGAVSRG